ncbi:hypothetical protein GOBAR_AA23251 [Gossypium barbadense]|uniref:Uncharacterized protein n=1 Tax=Gossypium barbadense TaxID=3634 RepID=A0A2P5X256_GOSBA|nr:hypothetical protein GOBAR_AA23251 [Gossypium barbadense]
MRSIELENLLLGRSAANIIPPSTHMLPAGCHVLGITSRTLFSPSNICKLTSSRQQGTGDVTVSILHA